MEQQIKAKLIDDTIADLIIDENGRAYLLTHDENQVTLKETLQIKEILEQKEI